MKFLITNDDGWGSEGILALELAAAEFGEIWTVAPAGPQSGISHRITLARPLELVEKAERSYSLNGTPADCVRWAKAELDVRFDWIFSGINDGANLGADIFVSGTVAAAREAILQGGRSIAFSQHRHHFGKTGFNWTPAQQFATRLIPQLIENPECGPSSVFNVNFPDCGLADIGNIDVHYCELDFSSLPAEFQRLDNGEFMPAGIYNDRLRVPGKDVDLCFGGSVTVTGINLDLPNHQAKSVRNTFSADR